MTWVKKISPEWEPQEHRGIIVGDVVDFVGPYQKLVEEGNVILCDKDGNEISTYDTLGIVTEREMNEFKKWRELQQQEALRKSLEAEHDELIAQAAELKKSTTTTEPKKKSDFAEKMAAARAAKKAEREAKANA